MFGSHRVAHAALWRAGLASGRLVSEARCGKVMRAARESFDLRRLT